jgi:hypothetical protein
MSDGSRPLLRSSRTAQRRAAASATAESLQPGRERGQWGGLLSPHHQSTYGQAASLNQGLERFSLIPIKMILLAASG